MPESSTSEIFIRTEIPKSFRDLNDCFPRERERERELDGYSFGMRLFVGAQRIDFGVLTR